MSTISKARELYAEGGLGRIMGGTLDVIKFEIRWTARAMGYLLLSNGAREDLRVRERPSTIEELINFAFNYKYKSIDIVPSQKKSEIKSLLYILKEKRPKTMLEIGTEKGGTLFLFTGVIDRRADIISVDYASGLLKSALQYGMRKVQRSFVSGAQKLHQINADSHKESTKREVESVLRGRKLDFLFIDGDHTYDGVKMDYTMYAPLVRSGGIIGFHDIQLASSAENVKRFYNEIKGGFRHRECIENRKQSPYGIGVLFV